MLTPSLVDFKLEKIKQSDPNSPLLWVWNGSKSELEHCSGGMKLVSKRDETENYRISDRPRVT